MKTILLSIVLFTATSIYAQNPSMTIAHTGLSPNDELTVFVGDSIDFIYGSGGSHPMTEGWQTGETSTPILFVTQTVNGSTPSVTFTINTPGVYYFHCGTNPANSDNWGKITVLDSASAGIAENQLTHFVISPNPVVDLLTIQNFQGEAFIYSLNGKMLMKISSAVTNVNHLPSGIYFIKSEGVSTKFIKQ